MSNNHIIEQILASADIVKIIGKHVELKRSGNEFKGCCPFHGEKTPSFYVNPQKNLYNCFGCGVKGNALTFLKEYENMTAGEALKELSRQTGIELPKETIKKEFTYKRTTSPASPNKQEPQIYVTSTPTDFSPSNQDKLANAHPANVIKSENPFDSEVVPNFESFNSTPVIFDDINFDNSDIYNNYTEYDVFADNVAIAEQDDGSSSLYDLLAQVAIFYQQQLTQNDVAQQYFLHRGLTQTTIEEFGLGYAPASWQHLEQAFPKDIEGLKILGLLRSSQKGNDYSLLRHRVIFPIRDNQGRIVGFGGRALNNEDMPKYINSSDSPVFHKQHILYGLYESRKAKAKNWLVVEGYMDVISLYQAGVYGAVASMGTAIATSQIEKLLQLNPVLTLSFDGDSAGQKAAWRAMEVGLPALTDGKELRFLTLPNNHDPDSFVKAFGKTAMQTQLDNAMPMSQYLFSVLSRRYDITIAEGRNKLLAEISELTRKLPKGSYGWLLREDMRSRMGLGKRAQARTAHDALLNFNSHLTTQLMLQMCFLYQPELLGSQLFERNEENEQTKPNAAFIEHIYFISRAFKVFIPPKKRGKNQKDKQNSENLLFANNKFTLLQNENIPRGWHVPNYDNAANLITIYQSLNQFYSDNMLTWNDIVDDETLQIIEWIQLIQPKLQEIGKSSQNEYQRVNAQAHFILAGLPFGLQQRLLPHWINFFNGLSGRQVTDVSILTIEIMLKMMIDSLQNRQIRYKTALAERNLCIKHQQALISWQRAWLQQKDE